MTYAWIVQNVFLALSVGRRNLHYIEFYGLAYKRIAVVIFLLLVIAGLITLLVKVRERKTTYFLFHRNAWILYAVLIAVSAINWDNAITRYNLNANTRGPLDQQFLMFGLSDKNLPLLIEYNHDYFSKTGKNFFPNDLRSKRIRFYKGIEDGSILSWNYPDWKVKQYLENH